MIQRYSLKQGVGRKTFRTRSLYRHIYRPTTIFIALMVMVALAILIPFGEHASKPVSYSVSGQNYEICDDTAEFLTSPWTYTGLASGTQTYTVAQYEALSGYGTTLPTLPSYITGEGASATAAIIFAPGSNVNQPPYDLPSTPILYFFEGGAYSQIGFDSLSGDEFIGGSAAGYPEPVFNDGGNAGGIDQQNATYDFSGGQSTMASTANIGATTVTTTDAIPGYINYVTFSDGSTYQLSNVSGTTLTLSSPLSSSESAGSTVWANRGAPIAELSSSASQGAGTAVLTASSVPLMQYADVVINSEDYILNSASGSQSAYTIGFQSGGLDMAGAQHTPVYYGQNSGDVTVQYLNINNDQHTTTGTITTGSGWTISNDSIHDGNSGGPGYGVAIYGGDYGTIEYNCISKMGDYAANVFGTNSKFDYNEVYETNYQADPGCGCSGGGKWWGTLNADIVDNAFINDGIGDDGFAVWLDNGNSGTQIAGNYFYKTGGPAISSETGFNLNVTGNMFEDDNWASGTGCGDSNCSGDIGLNSSGGFYVPGSRYENQMSITNNSFINDWGGVGLWQSGARSCENSGESWPDDASYCSGGFPNTAAPAANGQYYFSHDGDDNHGGTTTLTQAASSGSTKILVQGAEAIDDQIDFADPASTTTTSTTDVATLSGSGTVVATTTGFPTSGQLRVGTSQAWGDGGGSYTGAILSYTGKTAGSFTGVSLVRGSGTLAGPVQQVQPYKVTAESCYANDCSVTISPALASNEPVGNEVTNAGTCQLYATSAATATSPLAPDGTSYVDGCQWETGGLSVSGNNFVFQPTVMASSSPLTGGGTTTACTAAHADDCGTNFMAYQAGGEPPFDSNAGANAMMSSSSFTGCPNWDSGCTTDPLANINALANPPGAPANNGQATENDVWSNNTYVGPWGWNAYEYGNCDLLPTDSTNSNKTMPASDCNGPINYASWQGAWQQDQGSSSNTTSYPNPTTPSNVHATANSPTSVTTTWTASTDSGGPGIGGYNVFRNGTQIGTSNSATTSYTDTAASPGTLYTYTVQAYDTDSNVSSISTGSSATTPTSALPNPTTPTNVNASANSSSSVAVTWSASSDTGGPGLSGYTVFRNGTQIGTTNAATTNYTDPTVSASTSYAYTVEAFDLATPANVSAQSSPAANVTTPSNSNPTPTTPTNVHASANSATSVTVTWTGSTDSGGPGIGGYYVFRNGSQVGSTTAGTTSVTDTTVSPNTLYSYTIQAYDTSNDTSAQSTASSVTTPNVTYPNPSTPTNVTATANSPTSVSISWSASTDSGGPGLGGYYVFRNGTKITSINSSTTNYTDPSVAANTTYSYTVESHDTATPVDISSMSAASSLTTPSNCLLPLYRLYNPQNGDHLYTTNYSEVISAISNAGYKLESIVGYVNNFNASGDTPLYRFLNKTNGTHFFTVSAGEQTALASNTSFSYEGIVGYVASASGAGVTELYRLYNSHTGIHFYTSSAAEESSLVSAGFVLEGNAGFVYTTATASCHIPLYRLLNSHTGDHLYTTNSTEVVSAIGGAGFIPEGIAGYVDGSSQAGDTSLYRIRQNSTGYHFYTISSGEETALVNSNSYTSEGIAGYVSSGIMSNGYAFLRLYNPQRGQHFYTDNAAEANTLTTSAGFIAEGNAGYVWGTE